MKSTSDILIESLPYIKKFKDQTIVIKIGGSVLDNETTRELFAQDVCYLRAVGVNVVVVHGGGKEVTKTLDKAGRPSRFIDGYRYTSPEDIEIIEMLFSAKICKSLVSSITCAGGSAVGLSGRDAGMLRLEPLKGAQGEDLGLAGRIVSARTDILSTLMASEYIPVVSSIGFFHDGSPGNINADEVASAIASELKALKLVYVSDVDGLVVDAKKVDELDLKELEAIMSTNQISGGMLPKIHFTISALKTGIDEVHFVNGNVPHSLLVELFTDKGIGTKFSYTRRKK